MLNGGKDISNLPLDWQKVVLDVLSLKKRINFGVSVLDNDLNDKEKFAIEYCQDAIEKKRNEK